MGKMRTSKKISRTVLIPLWLLAALCLFGCIGLSVLKWRDLYGSDAGIDDSKSFFMALENSSTARQGNREYILKSDISLTVDEVNSSNNNFYGILDGNGHTITIKNESEDDESSLLKPIIDSIGKSAVIRRLNIVAEVPLGSKANSGDVALLANINNGTITDCTFHVGTVVLGEKGNVSALVNFNFGSISYVCIDVDKVTSDIDTVNWKCFFGAVATVNYSEVREILAYVGFSEGDDMLSVFNRDYTNNYVGYFFGESGLNASADGNAAVMLKNLYIFESTDRISECVCDKDLGYIRLSYDDIFEGNGGLITQLKDEQDGWKSEVWTFNFKKFPNLT